MQSTNTIDPVKMSSGMMKSQGLSSNHLHNCIRILTVGPWRTTRQQ